MTLDNGDLDTIDDMVDRTRPSRERHVDLVRATAILLVVLGHWLVAGVIETDRGLAGINSLRELGWAQPLTWVFQVMPLFFFIGGYANGASLAGVDHATATRAAWLATLPLGVLGERALVCATASYPPAWRATRKPRSRSYGSDVIGSVHSTT